MEENLTSAFSTPYIPVSTDPWLDLRLIPAYVCAVSLAVLLLSALTGVPVVKSTLSGHVSQRSDGGGLPPESESFFWKTTNHVQSHRGLVVRGFHFLRLLGCISLFAMSATAAVLQGRSSWTDEEGKTDGDFFYGMREVWPEIAITLSYAYAALLSLFTSTSRSNWRVLDIHATLILLVLFAVMSWRDLLPLGVIDGVPADNGIPAWLLWIQVVIVTVVAVIFPLLIPRVYRPVDPTDPASAPSPEQTASIISFLSFTFMDPIILAAYRLPHFPYERLPPLPDYDYAKNLAARSMDQMEPLRRRQKGLRVRHLFISLMQVFCWEYLSVCGIIILWTLAIFVGPLGINRLLRYLETGGQGTVVRPWVWILVIQLGRSFCSAGMNLYLYQTTHLKVQIESILLQLLFGHSLKVRLIETPSAPLVRESPRTEPGGRPADVITSSQSTQGAQNQFPTHANSSISNATKRKPSTTSASATLQPKKDSSSGSYLSGPITGTINTMVGTDLENIMGARDFLIVLLQMPLEVILSIWFLYTLLRWAAFIALALTLITLPLPGLITKYINEAQKEKMQKTNSRIQAITDATTVMRMIKMFAWEDKVKEDIDQKRNSELSYLWKRNILDLLNNNMAFLLSIFTMIMTYAFYALIMKQPLDASRLFPSMFVFDSLRNNFSQGMSYVSDLVNAKVSFDRITDFLSHTELLDTCDPDSSTALQQRTVREDSDLIGFHKATFSWMGNRQSAVELEQRNFRLHFDEVIFQPGTINLIVGPTGCGKTSMLLALLGEMHFEPSEPDSWFVLPKSQGVSYAAQESWVQNETIKNNILFGEPYDVDRYNKVLYQCALEPDLQLFEAGDATEVGEKGLTLSGGQKARVTLARAIYSRARIVLLDDVLSALDVHTSRWVVDHCFRGDLLKGRTVLLVTHNVAIAAPVAGYVISLGADGRVLSQGTVAQAVLVDSVFQDEMKRSEVIQETEAEVKAEVVTTGGGVKGQLIVAEEKAEGRLTWSAMVFFLREFGGLPFWSVILIGAFTTQAFQLSGTWWLGVWSSAYEDDGNKGSEVNVVHYLGVYGLIIISRIAFALLVHVVFAYGSILASRRIHERLIQSVLRSTLRWLDVTPVGRMISRFTQDIRAIDQPLPDTLLRLILLTVSMLVKFMGVAIISPIFVIPGILIVVIGVSLGHIYMLAQMSVKRESSNWKSPLYSHFSAAIAGLVSIRAYGAEQTFQTELQKRCDNYARPSRTAMNLNRWIGVRADIVGDALTIGLAIYLVYFSNGVGASNTGFSLTVIMGLSDMILWWVRTLNNFEMNGNSIERVMQYLNVDQEAPLTEMGKPPAYWPASGDLHVENLSARYSADGPVVLHNLSFDINSGERVGIVGRTGSGKSSLTLSLMRMIPTTGTVCFDGLPTNEINLDVLRTNLTIIPQDPMLLSGTLRYNLDPFSQHDDALLNDALRAAGLSRLQENQEENRINLDTQVSGGGRNFSVGQRQIIALARAIVRNPKVLILDEATASVDEKTDNVIQASIREQLAHATLITIAHRLQTIADYDKIMVLDGGKLVEFDTPLALLNKENGYFRHLVEESGDHERLWELARNGRRASTLDG